ncbi:MAG: site-specific DNA-methyltransferase [Verrucomicrobiae bacterium]|nr:site-specific DNA-methyltransferase [Verrucomicrobiae bacterium]
MRRSHPKSTDSIVKNGLDAYLPVDLRDVPIDQRAIPKLARDAKLLREIRYAVQSIPTRHDLHLADSTAFKLLPPESVHLVLTSPPYWTLKRYRDHKGQLGHVKDYGAFLDQLDTIWRTCFDALVPGGRLIIVVGDVCLSRRENGGRHTVVPLHASLQERCRLIGFDNLAPIIWHKIANAAYEAEGNGGGFLGKPFEPNAVIKNDIEYILMQRKPGGYRQPSNAERILSVIPATDHGAWFQQVWAGVTGASTRQHPAPYPVELAERLVRMFSFVGDTVFDPFLGTGTTALAAAQWGRNSIGVEVDPEYFRLAWNRLSDKAGDMISPAKVTIHEANKDRESTHAGSDRHGRSALLDRPR